MVHTGPCAAHISLAIPLMQLTPLLSRERLIVLASLGGITLLGWLYLLDMTRDMNAVSDMPGMDTASMPMMLTTIADLSLSAITQ